MCLFYPSENYKFQSYNGKNLPIIIFYKNCLIGKKNNLYKSVYKFNQ